MSACEKKIKLIRKPGWRKEFDRTSAHMQREEKYNIGKDQKEETQKEMTDASLEKT